PVPSCAAGGIATPADAALMMQLGAEAVFVGSGIFKSSDPAKRAKAIVQATTHFKDPDVLARVSEDLGDAMVGIETSKLAEKDLLQTRGWEDSRRREPMNKSEGGTLRIGVLALQGDFALHARALEKCGVEAVEVRKPEQLDQIDGLIMPGGETTTLLKLMDAWGFVPALEKF